MFVLCPRTCLSLLTLLTSELVVSLQQEQLLLFTGISGREPEVADAGACAGAQVMMYNTYKDGMDVTVKHLVPDKLPRFVLRKASDAQQAAKAITQAAGVSRHPADAIWRGGCKSSLHEMIRIQTEVTI